MYCFRISSRVFSSRPSKYLSEAMCLGAGSSTSPASPAAPRASKLCTTSSIHLSTQRSASGAPASRMRPAPTPSRIFCAAASSLQPRALAASTATTSAEVRLLTSSRAATASLSAALCSLSFPCAFARLESSSAARFLKGSPNRSPERLSASTPWPAASTAACHSSRSAAASHSVFASSAMPKKTSRSWSWTLTVGTGAAPPNFFQPPDGTTSDSVGEP
mmetsp:Transcript_47439/g.135387  ORF Transcript_47439/g.135387 Transcript_47439/m.135387 type:complete len:219 (-) Transcript_47439:224-880(-)